MAQPVQARFSETNNPEPDDLVVRGWDLHSGLQSMAIKHGGAWPDMSKTARDLVNEVDRLRKKLAKVHAYTS